MSIKVYQYPTPDGGSQIEWEIGPIERQVEVFPDGRAEFFEINHDTMDHRLMDITSFDMQAEVDDFICDLISGQDMGVVPPRIRRRAERMLARLRGEPYEEPTDLGGTPSDSTESPAIIRHSWVQPVVAPVSPSTCTSKETP